MLVQTFLLVIYIFVSLAEAQTSTLSQNSYFKSTISPGLSDAYRGEVVGKMSCQQQCETGDQLCMQMCQTRIKNECKQRCEN